MPSSNKTHIGNSREQTSNLPIPREPNRRPLTWPKERRPGLDSSLQKLYVPLAAEFLPQPRAEQDRRSQIRPGCDLRNYISNIGKSAPADAARELMRRCTIDSEITVGCRAAYAAFRFFPSSFFNTRIPLSMCFSSIRNGGRNRRTVSCVLLNRTPSASAASTIGRAGISS